QLTLLLTMTELHSESGNNEEDKDKTCEIFVNKTMEEVSKASEVANFITIPINKFLPLFGDIITIVQEIIYMYNTAEANKRICGVLLDRVQAAEAAVNNLKIREKERQEFFTEQNIVTLRKLVNVIRKIADFIKKSLTAEFDSYMSSLSFTITIELKLQGERDRAALSKDIHETNQ
ncbi:2444_t:CDS:2, partial [Racocetra persica]